MKFGRLYTMTVEGRSADFAGNASVHTINFPLTVKFRIIANSNYTLGEADFLIYNLAEDVRNDIYKDAFEQEIYKQVTFSAGYQKDSLQSGPGGITIPMIFKGNILQAYSYRRGPDWVTEIHALDGGYASDNGTIDLTKPSGYNFKDLMTDIVNTMKPFKVDLGTIGNFVVNNSRGISFSGSPLDLIARYVSPYQGQSFIDKETVHIIQQFEYLTENGALQEISEEVGLIDTPMIQDALVTAKMIFEPRVVVGQQIKLNTAVNTKGNGFYKVQEIRHQGTISGAECETLTTDLVMYNPNRADSATFPVNT